MAEYLAKTQKAKDTANLSQALDEEATSAEQTARDLMTDIAKDILGKETQKLKSLLRKKYSAEAEDHASTPTDCGTKRSGRRGATSKRKSNANSTSDSRARDSSQRPSKRSRAPRRN